MMINTTDKPSWNDVTTLFQHHIRLTLTTTLVLFSGVRHVRRSRSLLLPETSSSCEAMSHIIAQNAEVIAYSDQSADGLIRYVRDELYSVQSIESIYVDIKEDNIDIWVVIPKRDIAVVRQIAESKGRILRLFASAEHPPFTLDFYVVYRDGRNEEDLLPKQAIRVPPQV